MAGRIGSVQKAQDGKTYGFVVFDEADRPSLYLGFGSWHDADRAAREAQRLAGDGAGLRAAVGQGSDASVRDRHGVLSLDRGADPRRRCDDYGWLRTSRPLEHASQDLEALPVRVQGVPPPGPADPPGDHRCRPGRSSAEGSALPLHELRQPAHRCGDDVAACARGAAVEAGWRC
jgi:hypothetical protein